MPAARSLLKARIRALLPGCPGLYADEIADRLAARDLDASGANRVITEMARSVIRHQLTEYDALRTFHELTPDEARLIVEPDVADWIAAWSAPQSGRKS